MSLIFSAPAFEIFDRPKRNGESSTSWASSKNNNDAFTSVKELSSLSKTRIDHEQRIASKFTDRVDYEAVPSDAVLGAKIKMLGRIINPEEKTALQRDWFRKENFKDILVGKSAPIRDEDRRFFQACSAPRTLAISRNGTLYICDELGDLVIESFIIHEDIAAVKKMICVSTKCFGEHDLNELREGQRRDAGLSLWKAQRRLAEEGKTDVENTNSEKESHDRPHRDKDDSPHMTQLESEFETLRKIDEKHTFEIELGLEENPFHTTHQRQVSGMDSRTFMRDKGISADPQKESPSLRDGESPSPLPPPLGGFAGLSAVFEPPPKTRVTFVSSLIIETCGVTIVTRHIESLPEMPKPNSLTPTDQQGAAVKMNPSFVSKSSFPQVHIEGNKGAQNPLSSDSLGSSVKDPSALGALLSHDRAGAILGKSFSGVEALIIEHQREEAMRKKKEPTTIEMFGVHRFVFASTKEAQHFASTLRKFLDSEVSNRTDTLPITERRTKVRKMLAMKEDHERHERDRITSRATAEEAARIRREEKRRMIMQQSSFNSFGNANSSFTHSFNENGSFSGRSDGSANANTTPKTMGESYKRLPKEKEREGKRSPRLLGRSHSQHESKDFANASPPDADFSVSARTSNNSSPSDRISPTLAPSEKRGDEHLSDAEIEHIFKSVRQAELRQSTALHSSGTGEAFEVLYPAFSLRPHFDSMEKIEALRKMALSANEEERIRKIDHLKSLEAEEDRKRKTKMSLDPYESAMHELHAQRKHRYAKINVRGEVTPAATVVEMDVDQVRRRAERQEAERLQALATRQEQELLASLDKDKINRPKKRPVGTPNSPQRTSTSPSSSVRKPPSMDSRDKAGILVHTNSKYTDSKKGQDEGPADAFLDSRTNRLDLKAIALSISITSPEVIRRDVAKLGEKVAAHTPYPHFRPKYGIYDNSQHKYTAFANRSEEIHFELFSKPQYVEAAKQAYGDMYEGQRWKEQQLEIDQVAEKMAMKRILKNGTASSDASWRTDGGNDLVLPPTQQSTTRGRYDTSEKRGTSALSVSSQATNAALAMDNMRDEQQQQQNKQKRNVDCDDSDDASKGVEEKETCEVHISMKGNEITERGSRTSGSSATTDVWRRHVTERSDHQHADTIIKKARDQVSELTKLMDVKGRATQSKFYDCESVCGAASVVDDTTTVSEPQDTSSSNDTKPLWMTTNVSDTPIRTTKRTSFPPGPAPASVSSSQTFIMHRPMAPPPPPPPFLFATPLLNFSHTVSPLTNKAFNPSLPNEGTPMQASKEEIDLRHNSPGHNRNYMCANNSSNINHINYTLSNGHGGVAPLEKSSIYSHTEEHILEKQRGLDTQEQRRNIDRDDRNQIPRIQAGAAQHRKDEGDVERVDPPRDDVVVSQPPTKTYSNQIHEDYLAPSIPRALRRTVAQNQNIPSHNVIVTKSTATIATANRSIYPMTLSQFIGTRGSGDHQEQQYDFGRQSFYSDVSSNTILSSMNASSAALSLQSSSTLHLR